MGNTDIEDSLQRLDKLTQEEANMASAELLRITYSVDGKLDGINRSSSLSPAFPPDGSDLFTVNLLRDNFLRWLSPSDPSTNHNVATKAHHDGTAQWFFQGSIFNNWKSAGSFLWIHGKREFLLDFTRPINLDHLGSIAGSGKSVLTFVLPQLVLPHRTQMINTAPRSFKIS